MNLNTNELLSLKELTKYHELLSRARVSLRNGAGYRDDLSRDHERWHLLLEKLRENLATASKPKVTT